MLTVLDCIVTQHNLVLVGVAALICALASISAITLLRHARKSVGQTRWAWLAVSAVSTGFGIWATHFIAMLAFAPDLPIGYNTSLTLLSLAAAIVLTGVGLGVALRSSQVATWLGGAIVGGGIAAMHYTGMAAFEVMGRIMWDPALVTASIVLGGVLGALAIPVGLRRPLWRWRLGGAALLTLAICSHHFTAMGAVTIVPDMTIVVSEESLPTGWLAALVAIASVLIIVLTLSGLALDIRDRRRKALEADRMRGLANASVEGLLVCDGDTVATANESFATLVGMPVGEIVGLVIDRFFRPGASAPIIPLEPNQPVEALLRRNDGDSIPVELIFRPVDFAGKPHRAVAVRDLRARKEAEESIRFLAHHDALTGLPNRASFNRRLDQEIDAARLGNRRLAVLCFDLDRFKEVNDLFGHGAGDELLKAVGVAVTKVLRDREMLARLSGDEFAVVVPRLPRDGSVVAVAERILDAVRVATENVRGALASASIGVAVYPRDGADRHTLMNNADTALYRAKREGRGTWRSFDPAMGASIRDRRLLEHDLRLAITNEELHLAYQPQMDIRAGEVIGFEALLRWTHPVRGKVSPETFIEIAEETGAIIALGEWVLRAACAEAARWTRPLTIAVNVSAVQLHNPGFVAQLRGILLDTGLPGNRLEIEITETALIRDIARAVNTLRQIKAFGVRIAMDDFGTGYSSLSNLRAFAFDKIKVDRSFIKSVDVNEQAATIVRAVLGLGRGLGLPVLAEGVETRGELDFLSNETCDEAQGYLLGKPTAIAAFSHITNPGEAGGTVVAFPTAEARKAS